MDEFKLSYFLSPLKIAKWRFLLWRAQYYPRERLRALQWSLLSRQIDHCFSKVPYYRGLFEREGLVRSDFSSLDDLPRIPVINKALIEEHRSELRADDFESHSPTPHFTSGTTGRALKVYWDRNAYAIELPAVWRLFSWSGYRLGEPFLDLRRQDLDGHRWNWKCRGLEISADRIDTSKGSEYAALLRKYRIRLWRGCPPGLILLIEALKRAGEGDVRPRYVYSIAENLSDDDRAAITEWTGLPVHDHYTQQEHVTCIAQCSEGSYHIASEYGIVEILREDGTPAAPGEEGRIVGTGLHERSFPLLRYDTGDYGILSDRYCPCGRTLPLLEGISGRSRCCNYTLDGTEDDEP